MALLHKIHNEASEHVSWPNFNAIPVAEYPGHRATLLNAFQAVRNYSRELTSRFSEAEQQIQSMPDASPAKWHLAHTTWFWETFILEPFKPDFQCFDEHYRYLFNSYYHAVGSQYPRPKRGLIAKPDLEGVWAYRRQIDEDMEALLERCHDGTFADLAPTLVLGLNHEQQHQELIQTDIKHGLWGQSKNRLLGAESLSGSGAANWGQTKIGPLSPGITANWGQTKNGPAGAGSSADGGTGHFCSDPDIAGHFCSDPGFTAEWLEFPGGISEIGYPGHGFCFDNELARHQTLLAPFRIASRPVTAGEWLEFMEDGGYEQPLLWLSDGWQWKNQNDVEAPLYWRKSGSDWQRFALSRRNGPVAATDGAGAQQRACRSRPGERQRSMPAAGRSLSERSRRPCLAATNAEWIPINRNEPIRHISYYEADAFATWRGARLPREAEWEAACVQAGDGLKGAGACWEWTQSAYSAYPGFKPTPGLAGEYNGKFMVNQMVLRGGSPATPAFHSRPSYRNFFYPHARWQYSGLRLATDAYD